MIREYQYDVGNRMRKASGGIETIYSYNEADQLISKREAESKQHTHMTDVKYYRMCVLMGTHLRDCIWRSK